MTYDGEPTLHRELEQMRARAEAAERREAFLAKISAVLASSLDYDTTITNAARLAVPAVADLSVLYILEPGSTLKRVAVAHRDAARESLLAGALDHPVDRERSPVARPLVTGDRVLLPSIGDRELEEIAPHPKHRDILRRLGIRSVLSLPLLAHGDARGVLALGMADSGRSFDAAELPLAVELARRAALAVENANLYRASQQALRARERVLSIVSHDLRNPLNTIALSVEATMAGPEPPGSTGLRQLERIQAATRRMERLIQDLLDFVRLDAGQTLALVQEVQPLPPLVDEIVDLFAPKAATKSIGLRAEVASHLPRLPFDRDRLIQVLGNLVSNAIKFTPEGGEVAIRIQATAEGAEVVVADSGTGIDEEDLARVFDPYWQASTTASLGTGLGLPIAKAIIEAHGGLMRIDSRRGGGTTVAFTLPSDATQKGAAAR